MAKKPDRLVPISAAFVAFVDRQYGSLAIRRLAGLEYREDSADVKTLDEFAAAYASAKAKPQEPRNRRAK